MERVSAIIIIQMSFGVCKRIISITCTRLALMYVKAKYLLTASVACIRKSFNIGVYERTVFSRIKSYNSIYIGIFIASCQYSRCLRLPLYK